MCQMFMSANTHEPSADMTGAVEAQSRESNDQADVRVQTPMNHLPT
jgi:hypothetical protein